MDTHPEQTQRITLAVDPLNLVLRVPRSQERDYREASEELAQTLRIYRQKYPRQSELSSEGYLAMTAVDLAVRCYQTRQELDRLHSQLAPRLQALNEALEALITSARSTIDD